MNNALQEARDRFIHFWGEMGSKWGVGKTMAQIHAVLMIGEEPLSTDDIMNELGISRGSANTNLRGLVDWGLIRRVFIKGERKEYFQSEKDVWNMFCRIARERKKREIEPVIDTLQECLGIAGKEKGSVLFRERLDQLLDLVKTLDYLLGKIAQQERNAVIPRILKLLA